MSELTNPIGTISSQLMRWARQARTALMASCLQSVAIYLATSLGDCARYFGKLARRAAHELYLQNATRTLQQFDDRILADIGLRRAEIEQAVRNGRFATQKTLSNRMSSQQRHAARTAARQTGAQDQMAPTADALGLSIPAALLLRADEVIE
jgi:uncharacterized protein YjiS (DUF1127 family)